MAEKCKKEYLWQIDIAGVYTGCGMRNHIKFHKGEIIEEDLVEFPDGSKMGVKDAYPTFTLGPPMKTSNKAPTPCLAQKAKDAFKASGASLSEWEGYAEENGGTRELTYEFTTKDYFFEDGSYLYMGFLGLTVIP